MYPFSATIPNIKLRGNHCDPDEGDKDYILHNYHYMTLRELADKVGCSTTTVWNVLKSKGIRRYPKKQYL